MAELLFAALLLAVVTMAYLPALESGFIWDDPEYVVNNPTLRSLEGLTSIWFDLERVEGDTFKLGCATPQYYPLVFTAFWVEYRLFGLDPFVFHLVNVVLHGLNAILLWRVLKRISLPGALAAAFLFALHPVHVESVAWITERKNVLSLFFYLAAGLAYLRFRRLGPSPAAGEEAEPGPGASLWYGLALFLFLCALFSKTVTASFPAAVLLILWWRKGRIRCSDLLPLIPFFAAGAAFGLLTVFMETTHVGARGGSWSLPFLERCLVAGRVPWFYAWKLLWPMNLVFIYSRWTIDAALWWQALFPLATAAVLFLLWRARDRIGRGPLTAVLFFVGSLFPALGFFNVYPMRFSWVADHFQYLPSIGLIALFSAMGVWALRNLGFRDPLAYVLPLGAVLAVFCSLTWNQCGIYRDAERLWRDTLAKNPGAWIAHSNLAEILVAKGQTDEAIAHCRKALKAKPDLAEAHGNLANALYQKKRYGEALARYGEVLKLDPGNVKAMNNMAATLEAQGKPEEAVEVYAEVLGRKPDYTSAHYNMANALNKLGRTGEAIEHYTRAAALNPRFLQAHYRLGELYLKQGRPDEARPSLETALALARAAGRGDRVRAIEGLLEQIR